MIYVLTPLRIITAPYSPTSGCMGRGFSRDLTWISPEEANHGQMIRSCKRVMHASYTRVERENKRTLLQTSSGRTSPSKISYRWCDDMPYKHEQSRAYPVRTTRRFTLPFPSPPMPPSIFPSPLHPSFPPTPTPFPLAPFPSLTMCRSRHQDAIRHLRTPPNRPSIWFRFVLRPVTYGTFAYVLRSFRASFDLSRIFRPSRVDSTQDSLVEVPPRGKFQAFCTTSWFGRAYLLSVYCSRRRIHSGR